MSDADTTGDLGPDGGVSRSPSARNTLLRRIIGEVAANGLADRSLRQIAESVGSSHRMVLYHFGSRAGLVAAIVEATEAKQREDLLAMSADASSPADLVLALWHQVSSEELRPFVRLFFECVGITGGAGLTEPWLEVSRQAGRRLGVEVDPVEIRLGVAVSRGLLIDVLATGDVDRATRSLERFLDLWQGDPVV